MNKYLLIYKLLVVSLCLRFTYFVIITHYIQGTREQLRMLDMFDWDQPTLVGSVSFHHRSRDGEDALLREGGLDGVGVHSGRALARSCTTLPLLLVGLLIVKFFGLRFWASTRK